jgi:hypothetical protein
MILICGIQAAPWADLGKVRVGQSKQHSVVCHNTTAEEQVSKAFALKSSRRRTCSKGGPLQPYEVVNQGCWQQQYWLHWDTHAGRGECLFRQPHPMRQTMSSR